jgi:hypothetical protein
MASSSWKIMASPQVFRHDDIVSASIHQAGRRPEIKVAEFFNTTGKVQFRGVFDSAQPVRRELDAALPVQYFCLDISLFPELHRNRFPEPHEERNVETTLW